MFEFSQQQQQQQKNKPGFTSINVSIFYSSSLVYRINYKLKNEIEINI